MTSEYVNHLEKVVDRQRAALTKIAKWFGEFPDTDEKWPDGTPVSYASWFGSNGERDYMRAVARAALTITIHDGTEMIDRQPREKGQ